MQFIQPLLDDMFVSVLYVPAPQSVQSAEPLWLLYVPTGHTVQLEADDAENVPAKQLVQLAAPLPEYVPAMHNVQLLGEVAPTVSDDVPELQPMQLVAASRLYVPATHYIQLAEAIVL